MLSLTNAERENRGIARLSSASDLSSIAERHSRDMAARGGIYHNDNLPDQVGGNWRRLGENVGRGTSVGQVHHAFMNSSTHRVHILDPRYNQIGLGVFRGSDGYLYITEVFAQRGSTSRVSRPVQRPAVRKVVRHHISRPVVRRARRPARVTPPPPAPPVLTIGMLMDLLALDAPPPARKYIPSNRTPP